MPTDWTLRATRPELRDRYRAEHLWSDDTLGGLLAAAIGCDPTLDFRIWSDTRAAHSTIGVVYERARALAGGLEARGIGPGDVVAFQLPNWVEAAITFYGVSALGAVLVPVVHFYGPKELGYILRESRARALITADRFGHLDYLAGLEQLRPSLPDLELVVVATADAVATVPKNTEHFDTVAKNPTFDEALACDPDAPAVIGYTSGTTANPKGVIHSHRSLVAEVRQLSGIQSPGDRPMLVGAPVGHAIGMLSGLLLPVNRGIPIHLIDTWHPPAVLAAMIEGDLTAGSGSTFFLQSLLDDPSFGSEHLARMTYLGLGGSTVPATFADRAEALGISIARSFGSTEHPSTTGSSRETPRAKRNYTDGRPLAGVDVRLVDEHGHDVEAGTAGEILSRGPELFVGYTDPALNDAVDTDGWYATGDIGVLDDDGFLTITDRKKDVIVRGGENVSALEVEDLLTRMPDVVEAVVVAAPDRRLGEHGCAFVRVASPGSAPDLEAVRAHLDAAGLARQKWPEELRVVDELPRTPSGKVKKFVLRDALRSETDASG